MKFKLTVIGLSLLGLIIWSCNDLDDVAKKQETCLPTNLQNGVIAFYPFNSGSINDFSGNNYHLTNTTSATSGIDRAGNTNCAFKFIAANGKYLKYINPTFINDFQTLPFSISFWYFDGPNSTTDYELLIGRDDILHCPDTNGQWSIGLYDGQNPVFGINENEIWGDTSLLNNQWKHLVVTCQGTDLKIYVNGVLTTDFVYHGLCDTYVPTLNLGDLFIGKEFTGSIDDILIYNRILPTTEITQLYNLPACCQ